MDATLSWARNLFRRYYRREPVLLPSRFGRREYGFLFLGESGMVRHKAFAEREEIARFLATRGPSHAYHSAAYYERPDSTDMAGKGWLGADLIFDLDADHLPGAEGVPFPVLLERVRVETLKVAEEFLIGHFGFDESDLRIVFSGGRGYHIHVVDPIVRPLDSAARREIVDYVTGRGLLHDRFLKRHTIGSREVAGHVSEDKGWALPAATEPGWPGLFTRTLVAELDRLHAMDADEARAELVALPGIGERRATQLLDQITHERLEAVRAGRIDRVPALADARVIKALAERTHVLAVGEADEPVTADVKRLIRLPGSLHGKTGLRVTPLSLDELKSFDPLRDAVALGDEPIAVSLEAPFKVGLKGTFYELEAGRHVVPEHVAAFLVLMRRAKLAEEVVA